MLEIVREYGDSELPISDLVQEANTALMLAAIEYDGSEPWNELMTRRVKESVELALEEQRTENQIEETMAARVNVLQTVSQVLAKEFGREATLEELSAKMKMTEDEVRDIMKLALDALTVNGEGQETASVQDEEEGPNPGRNGWNLIKGEIKGDTAVVAHGGTLAHFIVHLLEGRPDAAEIVVGNASITTIEYDPVTGQCSLAGLNDCSHLM